MKQPYSKDSTKCAILTTLAGWPSQSTHDWNQDETYKLTVLHTNDNHGRFWQNNTVNTACLRVKRLLINFVLKLKQKGGSVLLLSGGDINTGVPRVGSSRCRTWFQSMNKIGYDAMALGNRVWRTLWTYYKSRSTGLISQCYLQTSTTKQQANASSKHEMFEKQVSRLRLSV